jgi:hypothetical protein
MKQQTWWAIMVLTVCAGVELAFPAVGTAGLKPLFKDFVGINGHFTFKPELYRQASRLARNYHELNWT